MTWTLSDDMSNGKWFKANKKRENKMGYLPDYWYLDGGYLRTNEIFVDRLHYHLFIAT